MKTLRTRPGTAPSTSEDDELKIWVEEGKAKSLHFSVGIGSASKAQATISANGEIWINPDITLQECKDTLMNVLKMFRVS